MPFRASFPPLFLEILVEVNVSGPPHVLRLLLGVDKGILPVKYFCSTMPLFVLVEFNGEHMTAYEDEVKWPPSVWKVLPHLRQWCLSMVQNE